MAVYNHLTKPKSDQLLRKKLMILTKMQKVHEFWHRREIRTLKKILTTVNEESTLPNFSETTLRRLLKHLNFEYVRNLVIALSLKELILCVRVEGTWSL